MLNIKLRLFNFLMRHLYNAVTEDRLMEVVFTNKSKGEGYITVGKQRLPNEHAREYITDAKLMMRLPLYKALGESISSVANDLMVNKSVTIDDLKIGKAILYGHDIYRKKVENIASLVAPPDTTAPLT